MWWEINKSLFIVSMPPFLNFCLISKTLLLPYQVFQMDIKASTVFDIIHELSNEFKTWKTLHMLCPHLFSISFLKVQISLPGIDLISQTIPICLCLLETGSMAFSSGLMRSGEWMECGYLETQNMTSTSSTPAFLYLLECTLLFSHCLSDTNVL